MAAGVDIPVLPGPVVDPWDAWLRLRAHSGRRATLVICMSWRQPARVSGPRI